MSLRLPCSVLMTLLLGLPLGETRLWSPTEELDRSFELFSRFLWPVKMLIFGLWKISFVVVSCGELL
jgi:hypothetical protein